MCRVSSVKSVREDLEAGGEIYPLEEDHNPTQDDTVPLAACLSRRLIVVGTEHGREECKD